MNQEEYRVKHNRDNLILRLGLTGMFIAYCIFLLIQGWNGDGRGYKIGLGVMITVVFAFFIGMLRELYLGRNEIILYKYGIEIRGTGLFSWDMIESFSTIEQDDPYSESVVLHFKEFADVKISLYGLEKNKDEMIELIFAYKGNSALYYKGHFKE
jgi:hypothetical protein